MKISLISQKSSKMKTCFFFDFCFLANERSRDGLMTKPTKKNENCYAAGILAISYPNPETKSPPLFLVGEDRLGAISDFGGRCERFDRPPVRISCASREFVEETLGLVGTQKEIAAKLMDASIHAVGKTANGSLYDQFIIEIQFDPSLPKFFDRSTNFLLMKSQRSSYHIEKTTLEWLTYDEIASRQKRSVFKETIRLNHDLIKEISQSCAGDWKNIVSKHRVSKNELPFV